MGTEPYELHGAWRRPIIYVEWSSHRPEQPTSKTSRLALDLSQVDWDAVKEMFNAGRQRTAAQKLRSMLSARITRLTQLNATRVDLLERFQKLLADCNGGSINAQAYFDEAKL